MAVGGGDEVGMKMKTKLLKRSDYFFDTLGISPGENARLPAGRSLGQQEETGGCPSHFIDVAVRARL